MRVGIDWRLCFIADSEAAHGKDILQLIAQAVEGGVTIVQLRGKKWTSLEFLDVAMRAVGLLKPKKIPLIINDRIHIALASEARGVHLGQDDVPLPLARELMGKERIIGISVSSPDEALAAEKGGADYIGVGPVFATSSKKDIGAPLGLVGLRRIREKVKIPILAIGGISAVNAGEVISAGADGLAVISAIAAAEDPRKAAAEIIESIGKIKNSRAKRG